MGSRGCCARGGTETWDDPQAQRVGARARSRSRSSPPQRLTAWLPKLHYPIRVGEHSQTAFAFGLMDDWAVASGDVGNGALLDERARAYYLADRNCPLAYEPSGEDFLSPCLAEADLMRRILSPAEFAKWLPAFLPQIPANGRGRWLAPGVVTDRSDPKLAHIDGLNLSRAWMLEGIASGLAAERPAPRLARGRGRARTRRPRCPP